MKAIVRILAPATLALAAASASAAGVVETDYPSNVIAAPAAGPAATGDYRLAWPVSEAAPVDALRPAAQAASREEVRREAARPRVFDLGYFS